MKKEEELTAKTYDSMADYYHALRTKIHKNGWFFNEMLEMPAMLYLIGNVKNKKVLDLGCGTGLYLKILSRKGAIIKGFDISKKMIAIARKENPSLDLKVGSAYNIPFKEKFDIVFAALSLHHMKNWNRIFKNVSRVLKNNGNFIFSTTNPILELTEEIRIKNKLIRILDNDYFKESTLYQDWSVFNNMLPVVAFYHKTYETIIKTILKNGFEIVDYKDAFPVKKSIQNFPDYYNKYSKIPFCCLFKLKKK